jgi:hypothetical protein
MNINKELNPLSKNQMIGQMRNWQTNAAIKKVAGVIKVFSLAFNVFSCCIKVDIFYQYVCFLTLRIFLMNSICGSPTVVFKCGILASHTCTVGNAMQLYQIHDKKIRLPNTCLF